MLQVTGPDEHQLTVATPNAVYGYGSERIVNNAASMADYIYNALAKLPKILKMQKKLAGDFKKALRGNQKVLELRFEKTEQLELVQKRLVEINADLDEKYDAEPEEQEQAGISQEKSFQKASKSQGVSL